MTSTTKPQPSWRDVKAELERFDRAGLLRLLKDLHEVSRDNQAFLNARLGLGAAPLVPYKTIISRWIAPDVMKGQDISVARAKLTHLIFAALKAAKRVGAGALEAYPIDTDVRRTLLRARPRLSHVRDLRRSLAAHRLGRSCDRSEGYSGGGTSLRSRGRDYTQADIGRSDLDDTECIALDVRC